MYEDIDNESFPSPSGISRMPPPDDGDRVDVDCDGSDEEAEAAWLEAARSRIRVKLRSYENQMPPEMLTSRSEEPSLTERDGVITAMAGCAVTAVTPDFSGDAYSFDASSGGTFHCKATDLIFEVGAAGRLRYGWREWPAELFQEQFVPISSTFDINWDGCDGGLRALMIPHYLDLKRCKHTSTIKVLHTRDGNIDVRDPQCVSETHVRVLTSSLSIFTAVLRWIPGLVYHVHAAVLVFKVPGSLTKLQLHVVPYADANIERLKRKLLQERYEYYNIPPKSDNTLVVAKRYALSCDFTTKLIQPQELTMENPPSDNNFFHVSFDGAFQEVFLALTKRGKQEKYVWTRMVQWRDKETAPQAPEAAKSRCVSPQSPEQLFDKIRSELPTLVGALQGNLTPLLIEFDAKKTLTPPEISQIRAVSFANGGFEAASQLVTRILEKHAGISVPVWEALWQTRDTYKKLRGLLSDVFPDRDP
ncbi:uncharacterized protein LOC133339709 isoform X1 [Lethenteron reissneri]|uniref:uncharacterized protein LOC133339709 isoform X1 n=2 Tax=Lethenteron reissneri TaxID=7753 RepID=UPI002AB67657|nr:uncharacterized protein LOC133339709 isoform X1 [Lethenteron reissneri]